MSNTIAVRLDYIDLFHYLIFLELNEKVHYAWTETSKKRKLLATSSREKGLSSQIELNFLV